MAETAFTFRLDEELKAAFAEAARLQGCTGDEPLRMLIQEAIHRQAETPEYDAWFRAAVEAAIREADDPKAERIPHEEVMREMKARIAKADRRAG